MTTVLLSNIRFIFTILFLYNGAFHSNPFFIKTQSCSFSHWSDAVAGLMVLAAVCCVCSVSLGPGRQHGPSRVGGMGIMDHIWPFLGALFCPIESGMKSPQ